MGGEVPVSLSTICGGALEEQFQRVYPAMISQLRHGQTTSISFSIEFKRVENTDTMVNAKFKMAPRFPAISKASICQVTGDNKLKTDAPAERPKVVSLFGAEGGTSNE